MVLLYSYMGKVEHYRVQRDMTGSLTVDDEQHFENLAKLVEVRSYLYQYYDNVSCCCLQLIALQSRC